MKPLNTDEEDRIEELEADVKRLESELEDAEANAEESEKHANEILDRNIKAQEELGELITVATGMRDTLKFG